MEWVSIFVAIAQFLMVWVVVPLLKTIRNQETQISKLNEIITHQQEQIDLLEAIVLESSDAEIVKKHLIKKGNNGRQKSI